MKLLKTRIGFVQDQIELDAVSWSDPRKVFTFFTYMIISLVYKARLSISLLYLLVNFFSDIVANTDHLISNVLGESGEITGDVIAYSAHLGPEVVG